MREYTSQVHEKFTKYLEFKLIFKQKLNFKLTLLYAKLPRKFSATFFMQASFFIYIKESRPYFNAYLKCYMHPFQIPGLLYLHGALSALFPMTNCPKTIMVILGLLFMHGPISGLFPMTNSDTHTL